jgi:hypothetical protein
MIPAWLRYILNICKSSSGQQDKESTTNRGDVVYYNRDANRCSPTPIPVSSDRGTNNDGNKRSATHSPVSSHDSANNDGGYSRDGGGSD